MKKLMMFAAAMTIVGSAFAIDVYDYKASVKNPDLKGVKVRNAGVTTTVTVKYVKSTSLYGYLVNECQNCDLTAQSGFGYLVLGNKADKAKNVSILPADLMVNIWPANGVLKSKKWLAEGYLFAGDGKEATPPTAAYVFSNKALGGVTELLFGQYNHGYADPTDATKTIFADAWLDASGFGRTVYVSGASGDLCTLAGDPCQRLDTLSGSVIGGMFMCAPSACEVFLCLPWTATSDVVTGTWSIKRNTKVAAVAINAGDNSLGDATVDAWVNGAIKKINSAASVVTVVPVAADAADFPRVQASVQ